MSKKNRELSVTMKIQFVFCEKVKTIVYNKQKLSSFTDGPLHSDTNS